MSHRPHYWNQIQPENRCVTQSNRGYRTSLVTSRQRRSVARIRPTLDYLEARTLLTTSLDGIPYLVNPPSEIATIEAGGNSAPLETSSTPSPIAPQETLDVQLQPDVSGAFSQLMPLLTATGATVQPTLIDGLYEVSGASADGSARIAAFSQSPRSVCQSDADVTCRRCP